ncbi:Monocopper oxidase-like protein SKU5 [Sesamum alatum]|uniref:Monocopper oxidase-like protein SKU5 n=1 Tax=Sesamum alatum TaxID=300844 RepID=A0AAE1YTT2_9LAMI|nr:Monocopper oxidase-like protein SKU5 [Sesamum alatum]
MWTLSQTFLLHGSFAIIDGSPRYTVNNVTYITPSTPLKLADQFLNGSGVYELDAFPIHSSLPTPVNGTFVVSGIHKGWLEIVFKNDLDMIDSWHLDGFGFFVVGFSQLPIEKLLILLEVDHVYPGDGRSDVYLDNPGMWNLRSQNLQRWYLGQELYIRVYDPDPNPAKSDHPPITHLELFKAPPLPPPSLVSTGRRGHLQLRLCRSTPAPSVPVPNSAVYSAAVKDIPTTRLGCML